jgi:hypothetical protein
MSGLNVMPNEPLEVFDCLVLSRQNNCGKKKRGTHFDQRHAYVMIRQLTRYLKLLIGMRLAPKWIGWACCGSGLRAAVASVTGAIFI